MALTVTAADRYFSLCVRERARWRCEVCQQQYAPGRQGLHCSHFWSRRYQSVRHDPDNAAAHCFGCHQRLGGNPLQFAEWIGAHLGAERVASLAVRKERPLKIKRHLPAIGAFYRHQYALLLELRARGHVGRLEFEHWSAWELP